MTRTEQAREFFLAGYNCAQATLMPFADVLGMDEATCGRLALSFGGGVGGSKNLCGVISALAMVLGAQAEDYGATHKQEHYKKVRELMQEFSAEFGSCLCADLTTKEAVQDRLAKIPAGEQETYRRRQCLMLVERGVAIIEEKVLTR